MPIVVLFICNNPKCKRIVLFYNLTPTLFLPSSGQALEKERE